MSTCDFKTAIVYNKPNKLFGLPPFYYRWRVCNVNLTGNTPADQYQKLKQIQNTVRVYSSLYTSNLGPLSGYKKPITKPSDGLYGVCWNQMSDRPVPSVQKVSVPTGFHNNLNNRHYSVTSSKPGSQTPGGIGCDIKHNSYDRYLNRLKAKGPLRRGVVPTNFGVPIPFNPAFPIYGAKTVKTNIVNGCDCPIETPEKNYKKDIQIYDNPYWQADPTGNCEFSVGTYVYAMQSGNNFYTRAIITDVTNGIYTIEFDNGTIQTATIYELLVYFPCNCGSSIENATSFYVDAKTDANIVCSISDSVLLGNSL
jgi:hypothetical protein